MRFAKLFLFLLLPLSLVAGSVNIRWNFQDFTASPQSVRTVQITPLQNLAANSTNIVMATTVTRQTGTNGSLTVSNMLNGLSYRVAMFDASKVLLGSLTNYITTNAVGDIVASDYIAISTNLGSGIYAYSIAQADARFSTGGGSGLDTNSPLIMKGGAALGTNGSITLGQSSSENILTPSAGLVNFSQGINAQGNQIQGHHFYGDDFSGSFLGNGAGMTNVFGTLNKNMRQVQVFNISSNFIIVTNLTGFVGGYSLVFSNWHNYGSGLTNPWVIWRNTNDASKFLSLNDPTVWGTLGPKFPWWSLGPSNDTGLALSYYTGDSIPSTSWYDSLAVPVDNELSLFAETVPTITNSANTSYSLNTHYNGSVFVSSSIGDDFNDGQTEITPVSSVNNATTKGTNIYVGPGTFTGIVNFKNGLSIYGSGIGSTYLHNTDGTSSVIMTNETRLENLSIDQIGVTAIGGELWIENVESSRYSPNFGNIDSYTSGNVNNTTVNWRNCWIHSRFDLTAFMSSETNTTHNFYNCKLQADGYASDINGYPAHGIQIAGKNVTANMIGGSIILTNGFDSISSNALFMFTTTGSNVTVNVAATILDTARAPNAHVMVNQIGSQAHLNGYGILNGTNIFFSPIFGSGYGITNMPLAGLSSMPLTNSDTRAIIFSNNFAAPFTVNLNTNTYGGIVVKNYSNGTNASGEIAVIADNGSLSSNLMVMGMNGSRMNNYSLPPAGTNWGYIGTFGSAINQYTNGIAPNLMVFAAQTNTGIYFSTGNGLAQTNLSLTTNGLNLIVGQYTGSGAGLTAIPSTALPSNIVTNNGAQTFTAAQRIEGSAITGLVVTNAGNAVTITSNTITGIGANGLILSAASGTAINNWNASGWFFSTGGSAGGMSFGTGHSLTWSDTSTIGATGNPAGAMYIKRIASGTFGMGTNLVLQGALTATNGLASYATTNLAVASTSNWTNLTTVNVNFYCTSATAVTLKNPAATTIVSLGAIASPCMIHVKPNYYLTGTAIVGTYDAD